MSVVSTCSENSLTFSHLQEEKKKVKDEVFGGFVGSLTFWGGVDFVEDDNFECEVAPFFPSSRVAPVSNFCHGDEISNFTHHSFISSLEEFWFTRFHVWTGCWCSRQGWSKKCSFFSTKKFVHHAMLLRCTILSETGYRETGFRNISK